MSVAELDIQSFYPPELKITGVVESEDQIIIHMHSVSNEATCHKCGAPLRKHHGTHRRRVQDLPILGKRVMLPKLHSTNLEGMELIRPMYCIREEDILAWRNYNELEFIQCACRFTENCSICDNGGGGSKRQEIKTLIRRLKRDNPLIETSIFNSIHYDTHLHMPDYSDGAEGLPSQRADAHRNSCGCLPSSFLVRTDGASRRRSIWAVRPWSF